MTQILPPKKDVALALLERSNVDVYLDPRSEGVVVPPQYRKEPRLILKIGLNMPVPIPDLRLDDDSMSCTLSFNRARFYCVVPWMSVFAIVGEDGRGMVWPDDVPQELAIHTDEQGAPGAAREGAAPSSRGKGRARLEAAPEGGRATAEPRAPRAKRSRKKKEEPARPVLRAVPPPEPSAPRMEKVEGGAADAPERRRGAPRPAPAARDRSAPPSRPKRELPPYLRVVK